MKKSVKKPRRSHAPDFTDQVLLALVHAVADMNDSVAQVNALLDSLATKHGIPLKALVDKEVRARNGDLEAA